MLEETARTKLFEMGVAEEDVLERIHQGLQAGEIVPAEEGMWVVRRLAEILAWPLPASLEPPVGPPTNE